VDLSQELISDWTYQKFQAVATWVFEKHGHFGRIDVALDDRNGVIDVDADLSRQYRPTTSFVLGNGRFEGRKSSIL
jgi:hypothetical protein